MPRTSDRHRFRHRSSTLRGVLLLATLALLAGCTGDPAARGAGGGVEPEPTAATAGAPPAAPAAGADGATADGPAPNGAAGQQEPTSADPAGTWERSAAFRDVDLPSALTPPAERVRQVGLLPGGDAGADKPAMLTTIVTSPAGDDRLVNWTPAPDGGWAGSDVPIGEAGTVGSADVAADGPTTAIGGWSWRGGVLTSFLLVSADRRSFSPVSLPEAFAGIAIAEIAVLGTRLIAVGSDSEDRTAVLTAGLDGTAALVVDLPELADDRSRSIASIVGAGEQIVLLGQEGVDGAHRPPVAWRSQNAGRTFAEAAPVSTDVRAVIAGAVLVADGYLATGQAAVSAAPDAKLTAAAWWSGDGLTWVRDDFPVLPDFPVGGDQHTDAGLSAATAVGDDAVAVGWSNSSLRSVFLRRSRAGEWTFLAQAPQLPTVGASGVVVPVESPGEPRFAAALSGSHSLTIGLLVGETWTRARELGDPQRIPSVSQAEPSLTGPLLLTRRPFLEPLEADGYRTGSHLGQLRLGADGALAEVPVEPEQLVDASGATRAVDPRGTTELAVGTGWTADRTRVEVTGFTRAAATEAWQPWTGLGGEGYESIDALATTGAGWVAGGERAVDPTTSAVRQAMVWTSPDGRAWSRVEGDFSDGTLRSAVVDVCVARNGTAVAVGWAVVQTGLSRPAAWTPVDGRWRRFTTDLAEDVAGYFQGCAVHAGDVVTSGRADDRSVLWTTSTGQTFEEAFRAPEADTLGAVVPVDGGFAAVGSRYDREYYGQMLWLSDDGARWSALPVPARSPTGSTVAVAVGADLLIVSSTPAGAEAWIVSDMRRLIRDRPPG